MIKPGNMTDGLHAMKIRILSFLILMFFPVIMMGQAQASANVSATITAFEQIESIPDSADLHFRIRGVSDFLMNLTVTNANGPSSTDIMASASTDLFLPGRRTPGTVIIFNYN